MKIANITLKELNINRKAGYNLLRIEKGIISGIPWILQRLKGLDGSQELNLRRGLRKPLNGMWRINGGGDH